MSIFNVYIYFKTLFDIIQRKLVYIYRSIATLKTTTLSSLILNFIKIMYVDYLRHIVYEKIRNVLVLNTMCDL